MAAGAGAGVGAGAGDVVDPFTLVYTSDGDNMAFTGLTLTVLGKPLLVDTQLTLAPGRRYGFLGANGMGKTTLLKHIADRRLAIPSRMQVLYVEQEVVAEDQSACLSVLSADTVRTKLLAEEADLVARLAEDDASLLLLDQLADVCSQIRARGDAAAEACARRILSGLGFSLAMQDQPTRLFSGGWRMRISLAKALFMNPDLLLLDEPTNHLVRSSCDVLGSWFLVFF